VLNGFYAMMGRIPLLIPLAPLPSPSAR